MTATWPVRTRVAEPHRLVATVGDADVEVRCDDLPLVDRPEAWATAFALPAAQADAALDLGRPVEGAWLAGAAANVALAATWWGGAATLDVPSAPLQRGPTGEAHLLCFTGGVDSFSSLVGADAHGQPPVTHLLYVVGFDVDLDDGPRAEAAAANVRGVASALGLGAVVVRTDLRRHPRFDATSWERTHGAALAAVALLLDGVGTVTIPPSYQRDRLVPWGSRPDLDPRWGLPGTLEIRHGDASGRRIDRVRAIARHPLVHRHLWVCWQGNGATPNCGRCEKCVRTATMLSACGVLDRCQTLPGDADLPERIVGLGSLPFGIRPLWEDLLPLALPDAVAAAVQQLLDQPSG